MKIDIKLRLFAYLVYTGYLVYICRIGKHEKCPPKSVIVRFA